MTLLAFAAVARVQADDASYIAGIVAKLPADLWQRYQALNAAETRLPEYRDTDEALALKLAQLDHVNASRTRNGAGLVELDILASRVANRQAMEAAQNGFHGHWNLRGEKPYHRYAFAGGTDHVAENASWSSTTGVFTRTSELVSSMMVEAHGQFMAELAPNDGHKQNCIAREHTHVGLGFFLARSAFAYYEEFVDRYLEFIDPPFQAVAGNPVEIAVRPLKDGLYTYAVITYYEPFPKAMTVAEVNAHSSYPDFTNVQDSAIWPWELRTDGGGVTRIPLAFSRPGLYYVHIYLDTSKPSRGRADTRGKVQASGLVIRVQ
ncbi:MAG: hypothetical protein ABSG21_08915 [Spirochaetia bacterium]